jgi:microcystin-dependent protein
MGPTGPSGSTGIPSGTVVPYAGTTTPPGWLLCDGGEVPQASYPALYAVLGTTFGTPGNPANFLLPNMQQRFPVGAQGVTSNGYSYALGQAGGEQVHLLTATEMPSHSHTYSLGGSDGFVTRNGSGETNQPYNSLTTQNTSSTGGDVAHNNTPLFISFNFIIKT